MLNKSEYYQKVFKLVPCLEHANHLAQYLQYFQTELKKEDRQAMNIEHLNFLERTIRGYIALSDNPNLTDNQLSGFNDVQGKTLEFLSE